MPYLDKEPQKLFYTMGEVAQLFNVNNSLIRFWEKEFDILKPKKNKKGNRLFTPEDLKNFRLIHHLVKEKGYTLDGAKKELAQTENPVQTKAEIIEKLKEVRSFLNDLQKNFV